jgi:hypothetical protein
MARKILIALLIISFLLEITLCLGGFFSPAKTFALFGAPMNNDTIFLGYVIAWFLLFVSIICGYALWMVIMNKDYTTLCYLLGIWWIGIGLGIYFSFGKIENLFLDSLKGLLITIFTRLSTAKKIDK